MTKEILENVHTMDCDELLQLIVEGTNFISGYPDDELCKAINARYLELHPPKG